jgi:hypothetical protein
MGCLDAGILINVGRTPGGVAVGINPSTGRPVYVKGPYPSRAAAVAEVNSLRSANSAQRGGLYVVSASLSDHLAGRVHAVAKCLNGKPHRRLTF